MKKRSIQFLEKLIRSISPSGYEDEVAAVWQAEAATFADRVSCDLHGSSHAVVNAGGSPRIMFAGHYDEIGFVITHIDDQGYLWISPVGGWDSQIPQGQRVTIRGRKGHVRGVMGKVPIHLQDEEARKRITKIKELWVDIGAENRKAAEKRVAIGDPLVLGYDFELLQGKLAAGRGFDNRSGAFVVLEAARLAAQSAPEAEIHAVATSQEEIGLRGARTSSFGVDPLVGIAVDVTFATDCPGHAEIMKQTGRVTLGKGPVITRGPNFNPKLFDLIIETARKEKIPVQINAEGRGTGTDANAIQLNRAGVAAALVSLPNRYMHSPCEVVHLDDLEAAAKLLAAVAVRITNKTDLIPFPPPAR